MNTTIALLSLTALIELFIVVLIILKPDRNKSDSIFIFWNLVIILWIISDVFYSITTENVLLWANITYISALFLPFLYLYFSQAFLAQKEIKKKNTFLLLIIPLILLFLLLFNPKSMVQGGRNDFDFGYVYILYSIYMIVYFMAGYVVLFKKSRFYSGIKKRQINFIFYGSLIASTIISIGALILPFFGIYSLYFFSPAFTLVLSIVITYAIFKHGLFNTKVITTEIFSALIILIFLTNLLLSENRLEFFLNLGLFIAAIIFSALLIRGVIREVKSRERITKMARSLKKANVELQKLDEAKSEFISLASHQLRTPLSIIKGYISMMLEGTWGQTTDKQKEQLEKVYDSNERLIRLVEDLLTVSRMDSGRLKFNWELVSLEEMTDSVVKEFSQMAIKKKLRLKFIKPKNELPKVRIDSLKIRQVVQNLVDNALHYTKKGSVIINLSMKNGKIIFSIKDTGIGIPHREQKDLFEKFARGSGVDKMHTEGVGLGLYLGAKMTKAHNGKIWVKSKGRDKGSTFYFELPIKRGRK